MCRCCTDRTGFEIADMEAANRLTSVTQVSSLEDFMATAVAEGRDFTAIRTNSSVIIDGNTGATLGEETPYVRFGVRRVQRLVVN